MKNTDKKIPAEVKTNCIACNSAGNRIYDNLTDHLFGAKGSWSLVECGNCGLVWLDPLPSPEDIGNFYDDYYTHENAEDGISGREQTKKFILATSKGEIGYYDFQNSAFRRILGIILSLVGPLKEAVHRSVMWLPAERRGKLLDVGCGSGMFLKNMRRLGWDVCGIEPDPRAAEIAKNTFHLENIHTGGLEDAGFSGQSFDAVTMSHVIEHMMNPGEVLKTCFRLLKPGGMLVIVAPNASSLGRKWFKDLWRGWEPPRHLYIYNINSLRKMVSGAGFTIKTASTPASATYYIWLESLVLKKKASLLNKKNIKPGIVMKTISLFFWGWEYLLTRLGSECGEELLLIAEKPPEGKL